jgi:acyl-CoA thioester hydrolase
VYFRYIEQARINWLDSLGLNFAQDEQGVVVVNAFCNFMKSVEYPADLIIKTYIANPTRVGLDTFNVMSLTSDPETVRATSGATIVWVDFKTQKAASWPSEIKAKLAL